ncbi:hypothetical protein [Haloarchaeobius sp. DYHT-AS-18]|uniref:hypothetical protein n=1 Tax=Haloarchaeobius sp. DYHT-AS-18 TaxID=3446117 RepID=UPI003EC073E1
MMGAAMTDGMKRRLAQKMLDSRMGESVLNIISGAENELVSSVVDLQAAADLDDEERIGMLPSPEDRKEQIRQVIEAKLEGRFPEWWVTHVSGLENAGEAAEKADIDDWEAQKERWADLLRENGTEGETDQLAGSYVRSRYGCTLDEFEEIVVEWPDQTEDQNSRQAEEMKAVIASGVLMANQGIEQVTAELEDK